MQSPKQWLLAVSLGLACATGTVASVDAAPSVRALRDQVESSMRVKGSLDIDAQGQVTAVRIDQEDKIPSGVAGFITSSVAGWTFEPTLRDGAPVAITTPMNLLVIGSRSADGSATVEIRRATFVEYDANDAAQIAWDGGSPPEFPTDKIARGTAGDVYLLMRVGRDGQVIDAVAEQVNLRVMVPAREVPQLRDVFARSAIRAAKGWKFRVPSAGPQADRPFWVVRFPVSYAPQRNAYGRWQPYLPGPRQRASWQLPEHIDVAPDVLGEGTYLVGDQTGPTLRTALGGT
ncbi:protein tonB [Stenotrophomonas sp. LGBM10]|uniref:protein tonB n=1 Tax=Stenotrophomonas sp. LGBM10 TaxID=3390038 RepID=UPI00398B750E